MKATAAALIISCLAIAPAAAQSVPSSNEAKVIVVNANFQLSVPIEASATTADIAKALAQANDALTSLAGRQCDLMAASFKRECRVAQLNLRVNLNGRRFAQQFNDEPT
jgi:phosphosulfolactate phosphohydrolase-like enzyme